MAEKNELNVFNEMYDFIEKSTSGFIEKVIKDENILKIMSKWRDGALDFKTSLDRVMNESLKNFNIANRLDQERTLHKLNLLEAKVNDLSERLEKLIKTKKKVEKSTGAATEK